MDVAAAAEVDTFADWLVELSNNETEGKFHMHADIDGRIPRSRRRMVRDK